MYQAFGVDRMNGVTPVRVGEISTDCKEVEVRNLRRGVANKSLGTFGNRGTKTFLF
ncbi:hypothetical protein SAMN05660462_02623 [Proteiniborus ethanoligenes]|uniref:Uncharacterized protein n=1 Tax=Proteiniborus ethanoligenes TaxID=415015 RepID=A0A1H3RZF3_9FIRM|nr:hypothetical protein SAMN05660462_02623 [Proteiniborus ethanoligenes]